MSARVVDMTPTWRGILPLLVEIAADKAARAATAAP